VVTGSGHVQPLLLAILAAVCARLLTARFGRCRHGEFSAGVMKSVRMSTPPPKRLV